jgi:endogenous inhibitor of DNA gyrase (YacG/DUF329 family)
MVLQKCLYCDKEFMPRRDGRSHSFCSNKCRLIHRRKAIADDMKFRRENGLRFHDYLVSAKHRIT